MVDLSFPIFKLEHRLDYERELLANGVEGMRWQTASSEKGVEYTATDEETQASYDAAIARVAALEEAIKILKAV